MLDPLLGVQHHNRVSADHRQPDGVPLAGLRGELDGLVEDEVHEWVEAAEDPLDGAVPVDLEVDPLVHELLQLGGMRLAAHDRALWDSGLGKTFLAFCSSKNFRLFCCLPFSNDAHA